MPRPSDKSVNNGASHANGCGATVAGKTQRDSGWSIRPETHWSLTGVIPPPLWQ